MCGRYQFTQDSLELQEIAERLDNAGKAFKTGEIFPTNTAPVLVAEGQGSKPEAYIWGFPHFKGNGVIINARSETAADKTMFRKPLLTGRCVVPTSGFFEWSQDGRKQKYLFRKPGVETLYLAGLFNCFRGENRYVILTTEANASISDIHNRMPVILQPEEIQPWLSNPDSVQPILDRTGIMLAHREVSGEA